MNVSSYALNHVGQRDVKIPPAKHLQEHQIFCIHSAVVMGSVRMCCGGGPQFKITMRRIFITRVQRVNRDFHCIVHGTYASLSLNFLKDR